MHWILKLAGTTPPLFLRDYRHCSNGLWSADTRCAEPFIRAIDALEMARRLSWIRGEKIEAARVPTDSSWCDKCGEEAWGCDAGTEHHCGGKFRIERPGDGPSPAWTAEAALLAAIAAFDLDEDSDLEAIRDPSGGSQVKIGFGHKF